MRIFTDISGSPDRHEAFVNDFIAFWSGNGYGGETQARAVFNIFDIEGSGILHDVEWELGFYAFDFDGNLNLSIHVFTVTF